MSRFARPVRSENGSPQLLFHRIRVGHRFLTLALPVKRLRPLWRWLENICHASGIEPEMLLALALVETAYVSGRQADDLRPLSEEAWNVVCLDYGVHPSSCRPAWCAPSSGPPAISGFS